MNEKLPPVAILIPTYERRAILDWTIRLLSTNLTYAGELSILVGDDSAKPTLGAAVPENVNYYFHGEQYGLGRNLNDLMVKAREQGIDIVMSMDDDHWLVKPLDITPHVRKLLADNTAGAIRLMGVGGHNYQAQLDGLYWRIDWHSPELYIASNRPHLKMISRFHGEYGPYPEGLKLGETEEGFCHTAQDLAHVRIRRGGPTIDVLVPLDALTESGWQHSEQHGGHSWQAEGF